MYLPSSILYFFLGGGAMGGVCKGPTRTLGPPTPASAPASAHVPAKAPQPNEDCVCKNSLFIVMTVNP